MSKILSLTNVISVSLVSQPSNLNVPNINTVALISQEVPSWNDAYKIYTNPSDVGTDFGSSSKAYAIAIAFFSQQPNPIGSGGYLVIIPRLQTPSLETSQAAILRTLDTVYYFGILIDEEMTSVAGVFASLTAYIQTLDKMFVYASSVQADYAPGGLLDLVRQAGETHTRCLYYADGVALDTQKFAAAYAARGFSTIFAGSNTTQTLHMKSLAGVVADTTLDQTELTKCQTAGVDVYANIAGILGIFCAVTNSVFDEVYNELWFKFAIQTAGFNYIRLTSTKIPQTEQGLEGLKSQYRKVCDQAVTNGFVGPGAWTLPQFFGNPQDLIRCIKDIGFYVYSQPISQQSQTDRVARKAPVCQIAIKTQGAIHSGSVIVNVNL